MTTIHLMTTEELEQQLGNNDLLIIDCCTKEDFIEAHIPGSVNIEPGALQSGIAPASGSLPGEQQLQDLFSATGISSDKKIICLDAQGGTWAGRLIWTLDLFGIDNCYYLDGGRTAWLAEDCPVDSGETHPIASQFQGKLDESKRVYAETILNELDDENFIVWDSRSPEEYSGEKALAEKAGHIPGAFLLEWTDLQQAENHKRLKPIDEIKNMLKQRGVTPASKIVTHCQSHRRSGLTWMAGILAGYDIRAYDGSWGDWGNREDTPVEQVP